MESKIKVAFAGLGNRGKDAYLPAFMGLKDPVVEIAAVADIDPEKVKDVAEKYNLSDERCFSVQKNFSPSQSWRMLSALLPWTDSTMDM